MADYQVSSYSILDAAVNTTKAYGDKINETDTTVKESKTIMSNTGVVMGPFQDKCLKVFGKVDNDFTDMASAFQSMASLLVQESDAYKKGDQDASNTVSSAGKKIDTSTLSGDIATKKQKFAGDVDDPNNYDPLKSNFRTMRKTMTMFDNTTGEELKDHDTITMKPGETRVITVKLPTDTGMIQEIHRTTADGNGAYRSGKYVHAVSDIDPDPNSIEYVNYKKWSQHYPEDSNLLHNNTYDWVITAKEDGTVQASQTCEYTTDASKGENLKAMINLNVEVKS